MEMAEELQRRFGCEGVSFSAAGGVEAVRMRLSNGSAACLALPHATLTSYKPLMWHGATEELLRSRASAAPAGAPFLLHGGIALSASFPDPGARALWSRKRWSLHAVDAQPRKYVQVYLTSVIKTGDTEGKTIDDEKPWLAISYIITLLKKTLITAVSISNKGCISVKFNSSIATFLATNFPEAVFAGGLRGSKFQLINTQEAKPTEMNSGNLWDYWRSSQVEGCINPGDELTEEDDATLFEMEGFSNRGNMTNWMVEKDDYAPFRSRVSRLYANPGESVLIIDRGKRRSVISRRIGFQNFFLSGPSLDYKLGLQDNYVCFGPSSAVQQIDLKPGQIWQGAQILHHNNL